MNTTADIQTRCCIVGGGPAGMMLGFLLARAGVEVMVLEKHGDFLRDFRGDTIHPSTLELMYELGLLDAFLQLPHQQLSGVQINLGAESIPMADFSHLPVHSRFIAFMPQWDFLRFLADQAKQFPTFDLRMNTTATTLLRDGDRVVGVEATTPTGTLQIKADLVVGTDGRRSTVRQQANLPVRDFKVPIDVLWMRIPKHPDLREQSLGYVKDRRFMVLIDRHDYFQCGFLVPKDSFEAIRQRGLEALRADLVELAPFLRDTVDTLTSWEQISLLTVKIDRLTQWALPGLLCIGDAAHAMSPAGGVGINLAIQDAVATANQLAAALRKGPVSLTDLQRVQRRREWPVRLIQRAQIFIHRRIINPSANQRASAIPALPLWLLRHTTLLRRFIGRMVGMGPRPEHIRSPAAPPAHSSRTDRH